MMKLFLFLLLVNGDVQVVEYTESTFTDYVACNAQYIKLRDIVRDEYGKDMKGVCVSPEKMQDFLEDIHEMQNTPNDIQKEA